MKKLNFKKLAILGVVTGTAMSGQVTAAGSVVSGTYLAAACGGSGNGGGAQGCASNSMTSTVTGPGPAEYYNAPNRGCSAGNSVNGQQSTQQQPMQQRQMQPQYQASCGGGRGYNPNARGNVAYNGNMPQGQMQPQMGCSAGAQSQGQYYQQNSSQPQGQYYQQNGTQQQYYQQNQGWNNGNQPNAQQGYVAEAAPTMQRNGMITEKDLMSHLNDQGKAMYQSLDAAGKARALKLAGEMTDKNQAVKMAASEMSAKRANATAPK